ncbi:putative sodium/calcium exchanger membrane region [Helianthus annuus]|uniref:Putative cation exchanger 11 n=1 Tax=Helianthus annuus TaxID=4232 RepID=A0A251SJP0_HELAN|nr:cation/calcium exchanger 5 [Helianthus annuus]KAJ0464505.1 putative sodium/calcium exchanger membrane region [Helianthus annuus]KAJ0469076.1 putative sodium/calcium exchanger membrane region [Helianthus annuus]KAJ0486081.1 putative sodium/calcium exchanger membrane region [Helianthus annuus]KAJ0656636.1 putative sodium/calcium exchanger membrane region [Helianthus annuus]KAJ0660237.1 putative sodium/calcium exchanger membrane region [Helianthus annuus]
MAPSSPTTTTTVLLLLTTLISFFLLHFPHPHPSSTHRRSLLNTTTTTCSHILQIPPHQRCSFSTLHCSTHSNGLLNYFSFHFCHFNQNQYLSIPFLTLIVILHFYILVKTAQDQFSIIVTKLSNHLNLSPSMGAVTLLALGNGAPDVFASVAAVGAGNARTGFGAILSAGTFVSALVVGFVAIYAAPFAVSPAPFVRDVLFYLTAALFLFYVYLSGEIFVWQAVGFVVFYLFFVVVVFWMDLGFGGGGGRVKSGGGDRNVSVEIESGSGGNVGEFEKRKAGSGIRHAFDKISKTWEVPVSVMLKLTIPQSSPSEWNRFYRSANIALCPILLMYSCKSFVPLDHPIVFLLPNVHFSLWLVVLFASSSFALVHFVLEKKPPKTEQMPVVLIGFIMSVFWISTMAGELLNCLAALGSLLEVPPSLLGLTVLAWGNSVGDLVADVAVAKAGQPAMAMAGCFAGPMFNMLFGLGTALVIQTANVYPEAYELQFHVSIVVAFVFLILSLMGSLLVVTWCRFHVPRFWGFCLVGLYAFFIALSLVIAKLQF